MGSTVPQPSPPVSHARRRTLTVDELCAGELHARLFGRVLETGTFVYRANRGKMGCGRTPAETFHAGMRLWRDRNLDGPAAEVWSDGRPQPGDCQIHVRPG